MYDEQRYQCQRKTTRGALGILKLYDSDKCTATKNMKYTVFIMYQPLVMFHVGAYEITLNLPGVSCEMCHGLVEAVLSRQYTETVSSIKKKTKI